MAKSQAIKTRKVAERWQETSKTPAKTTDMSPKIADNFPHINAHLAEMFAKRNQLYLPPEIARLVASYHAAAASPEAGVRRFARFRGSLP
jgi:hypothetical protein